MIAGQEVVRRQIDLLPGAPADEQNLPRAHRRQRRSATPPRFGPVARRSRRSRSPARRRASCPGRRAIRCASSARCRACADRLAGGALRRARRQPGQHRLLPGRHARAGAVSPRARARRSFIPYLVDGVDFYPGGYPASYGGYVSGIVAARTVAPPADRVHASADVTVYDAGGIVTAPWDGGRGTVAVAARYSYTGALFSLLQIDTIAPLRRLSAARRPPAGRRAGDAVRVRLARRRSAGPTPPPPRNTRRCSSTASICAGGARSAAGGCSLGVTRRRRLGDARRCSTAPSRCARSPSRRALIYDAPARPFGRSRASAPSADAQDFRHRRPRLQTQAERPRRARARRCRRRRTRRVMIRAGDRLVISPGLRGDLFAEQGVRSAVRRAAAGRRCSGAPTRWRSRSTAGRFAQMPSLPVSVAGFEAFGLADLGAADVAGRLAGRRGAPAAAPHRRASPATTRSCA